MSIQLTDIWQARNNIQHIIKKTPMDVSPLLSDMIGGEVFLKAECLQTTGSFKLRGAANKMMSLTEEQRQRGVVTASAGNHAQGVGYVSRLLGIDATIVIPENGSKTKIENTRRLGANVVLHGNLYDESEAKSYEIEKSEGKTYVHAFCDPWIIAGQGTVGLEMLEACPDLEVLLVPAGGGGLITGIATAAKTINPKIQVYGFQPETSCPWYEAKKQGIYVKVPFGDSYADGLVGDIAPEMVPEFNCLVDDVILLSEAEIGRAMSFLIKQHRLIVEGSGAVGVAAILENKLNLAGKKVGVVLSGSNVDSKVIQEVLQEK